MSVDHIMNDNSSRPQTSPCGEEAVCCDLETLPMPEELSDNGDAYHISLLANYPDSEETRFFLTPEACGILVSSGLRIAMEAGAGIDISFSDEAYADQGVAIVDRRQALQAGIILSYEPLRVADLRAMRDEAVVLCIMTPTLFEREAISTMLEKRLTMGCLDNMYSHAEVPIFANIIDEIDGRAAIMYAQEHLSFLGGGKGVLLAGVAGINPCEVLLIGEGRSIVAAAKAAKGAGASVTIMNNDVTTLAQMQAETGPEITALSIHPRVLCNKAKSADVILTAQTTRPFEFPRNLYGVLKETVYMLDIPQAQPSVSVPRTIAMALSNVLVNFLGEIPLMHGFDGLIATTEGVRSGIVTYRGKLVDKLVGTYLGMPSIDISVMLAGHN
ncbi:MAG: hypothetical protein HDS14_04115 [Bacteroides sp.]|nr:hypothetical protein [Bacteroides sp.]